MGESQDCLKDQFLGKSSEQILDEHGDKFAANSLWCGRVACSFLYAYVPYGVTVKRGTCILRGDEYTDSAIPLPEITATVTEAEPSSLEVPSHMSRSIHALAREAAAHSESFDQVSLFDDTLGHLSVSAVSAIRWLGYR